MIIDYSSATLGREQQRYDDVESLLRQALDGRQRKLRQDHPACFESLHELAVLYTRQACYEQGEPLFLDASHGRETKLGPEHRHTVESLSQLAKLYESWGRPEDAATWRMRLEAAEDK